MAEQTIVAVYDTPAHAELAVQDVLQAGIPKKAVHRHAREGSYAGAATTATARTEEKGFWASLFGGEPDHDTALYERSVQNGSNAVSVRVSNTQAEQVIDILESHKPIDLDERAGQYGLAPTTIPREPLVGTVAAGATAVGAEPLRAASAAGGVASRAEDGAVMQLSAEELAVGKRVVDRGTTRIRRFVVEAPVEEQVRLRDERVTIDRRPVTEGRPAADAFSDKVIEMTETAEEAVVSKTARVVEEVGLRREASDRTETVHDTVRREDVEVVREPAENTATTVAPAKRKRAI